MSDVVVVKLCCCDECCWGFFLGSLREIWGEASFLVGAWLARERCCCCDSWWDCVDWEGELWAEDDGEEADEDEADDDVVEDEEDEEEEEETHENWLLKEIFLLWSHETNVYIWIETWNKNQLVGSVWTAVC